MCLSLAQGAAEGDCWQERVCGWLSFLPWFEKSLWEQRGRERCETRGWLGNVKANVATHTHTVTHSECKHLIAAKQHTRSSPYYHPPLRVLSSWLPLSLSLAFLFFPLVNFSLTRIFPFPFTPVSTLSRTCCFSCFLSSLRLLLILCSVRFLHIFPSLAEKISFDQLPGCFVFVDHAFLSVFLIVFSLLVSFGLIIPPPLCLSSLQTAALTDAGAVYCKASIVVWVQFCCDPVNSERFPCFLPEKMQLFPLIVIQNYNPGL